jgi:hypothetical protein
MTRAASPPEPPAFSDIIRTTASIILYFPPSHVGNFAGITKVYSLILIVI